MTSRPRRDNPTHNSTLDRPAGSHSLAAAGQRARYAPHDEDALRLLANVTVAFVALSHVGFLILEMFFWDHPVGREVFAMTPEQSKFSAALAAKQGLYNGFLAGLSWSLWSGSLELKTFFLGRVVMAGAYGGATAKRSIWITQALPAIVALALVYAAHTSIVSPS